MLFKSTPEKKLLKAAGKGDLEEVRKLLAQGADLNACTRCFRMTALAKAAENGHTETARFLIDNGASLDDHDSSGWTALMVAAIQGQAESVKLLIDRGADLSIKDSSGNTALAWARKYKHRDIVAMIEAALTATLECERQKEAEIFARKEKEEQERQRRAVEEALKPKEKWVSMGEDKIAFIGIYPEMQKTLTHIFNFTGRNCLITVENMKTHAETSPPIISFNDLPEAEIEKALNAFTQKGGIADRDFVLNGTIHINKNQL